jgi:hypothetical protein
MPISGLTNRYDANFNPLGRIEVSAFKGSRKVKNRTDGGKEYEGYGKDLGRNIRLVTTNREASIIFSKSYGNPDGNGDFLIQALDIYLPFDEVDRTFATSMSSYKGSGLQLVCDRTNILKKSVTFQDKKGQYPKLVDCHDTPCPMQGQSLSMQCQHGCKAEGKLYFYVKELLDNDLMIPGQMTLHSLEDISYLDIKLREFKEMLGSITNAPFPCSQYKHKVPFILTRTEIKTKVPIFENGLRTGKRGDKTIYAMSIQIDPNYMALRRAWIEFNEYQARQIPVSQSVVKGLLRGDARAIDYIDVDVQVVEPVKMLEPASEWHKWKSPQDAIAWAKKKLPHATDDQLWQEFNKLTPINGKKAPAWYALIQSVRDDKKNYAD